MTYTVSSGALNSTPTNVKQKWFLFSAWRCSYAQLRWSVREISRTRQLCQRNVIDFVVVLLMSIWQHCYTRLWVCPSSAIPFFVRDISFIKFDCRRLGLLLVHHAGGFAWMYGAWPCVVWFLFVFFKFSSSWRDPCKNPITAHNRFLAPLSKWNSTLQIMFVFDGIIVRSQE